MEYRRLGKTGLQLSVLGFGSWVSFQKQVDDKTADLLMGLAYDKGVNFFDNAETYAEGESEKMMGRILKKKKWERSSFTVSSKVFFGTHGKNFKPNQNGLSRKHVMEACHEALQRLQVDYLDLFFCHRPDPNTTVEETVLAMNTLIQQGKILYWGTSEWSGVSIMEAHRVANEYRIIGPSMEQPQYNLLERTKVEKEFLPIYDLAGLGITSWSPLASGLLTGKYNNGIPAKSRLALEGFDWLKNKLITEDKVKKVKKLTEFAQKTGISMAALSIAWCIKNQHVTSAILGATGKKQLLENFNALEVVKTLSPEILDKIEKIMQTNPL